MNKGFAVPAFVIMLAVILTVPVMFWVFSPSNASLSNSVKGISDSKSVQNNIGFSVLVNSSNGTWDLNEYLCTDLADCLSSVDAGKRWGVVSGGQNQDHEILIYKDASWKDHTYLKLYVSPKWEFKNVIFNVADNKSLSDIQIRKIDGYDVALIPLKNVTTTSVPAVTFSN